MFKRLPLRRNAPYEDLPSKIHTKTKRSKGFLKDFSSKYVNKLTNNCGKKNLRRNFVFVPLPGYESHFTNQKMNYLSRTEQSGVLCAKVLLTASLSKIQLSNLFKTIFQDISLTKPIHCFENHALTKTFFTYIFQI